MKTLWALTLWAWFILTGGEPVDKADHYENQEG